MTPLLRYAAITCTLAGASTALIGAPAHAQSSTTIAATPTTTSVAPTTSTTSTSTTSTGRATTTTAGATGRTTTTIVGATETTIPPSQLEGTKPAYVDQPKGARQLAAAYAYRWAYETNPAFALKSGAFLTVPYDNPDQRGRAIEGISKVELDCTNHMSQALRAGGFQNTRQWWFDAKRLTASTAWVRANGPQGARPLRSGLAGRRAQQPRCASPEVPQRSGRSRNRQRSTGTEATRPAASSPSSTRRVPDSGFIRATVDLRRNPCRLVGWVVVPTA